MSKMNCNVIRDILPLYVDSLVCEETKKLVEEHLKKCEQCNAEYRRMANIMPMPVACDAKQMKKLKKGIRRGKTIAAIVASLISTITVVVLGAWLFFIGTPVEAEDIQISAEIVDAGTYSEPTFAVSCLKNEETKLITRTKNIYERNEEGEKILVGWEVEMREPIINLQSDEPGGYTFGYAYRESPIPSEDFDFTITIKLKDDTLTYSMREEGLF